MWRVAPDDHERMFRVLIQEYERTFTPKEEAA